MGAALAQDTKIVEFTHSADPQLPSASRRLGDALNILCLHKDISRPHEKFSSLNDSVARKLDLNPTSPRLTRIEILACLEAISFVTKMGETDKTRNPNPGLAALDTEIIKNLAKAL